QLRQFNGLHWQTYARGDIGRQRLFRPVANRHNWHSVPQFRADRNALISAIGRSSELLNVGQRTVARAREVQEHGAPELVSAVERGEVSVSAAANIATRPIGEQHTR